MHIMDKQVVRAQRRRREHSEEFKRELVVRSLEPGVSVAAIAMDAGINANLLFGWRRRHLEGQAKPGEAAAVLLPVTVQAAAPNEGPRGVQAAAPRPSGGGSIEIEFGGARVRVRGMVDEASLRGVLNALRGLA